MDTLHIFDDCSEEEWVAALQEADKHAKLSAARVADCNATVKALKRIGAKQDLKTLQLDKYLYRFTKEERAHVRRLVNKDELWNTAHKVPAVNLLLHSRDKLLQAQAVTRLWLFGVESLKEIGLRKGYPSAKNTATRSGIVIDGQIGAQGAITTSTSDSHGGHTKS